MVLSKIHLEEAWVVYPKAREHILDTAVRRRKIITQMNEENKSKQEEDAEGAVVEKEKNKTAVSFGNERRAGGSGSEEGRE